MNQLAPIVDRDLATAGELQRMLLPPQRRVLAGFEAVHRFEPAGIVSGDYVDLVPDRDGVYFLLGDVSGKGVAAAMLMAQLHAMFRTLVPLRMPLTDLMTRASALLCASSLPAQYATLVCGYLDPSGHVRIINAGHPPPLVITGSGRVNVRATGVPIGLFCESQFSSADHTLAPGDTLFLYTDGLSEARRADGEEYGADRIEESIAHHGGAPIAELVTAALRDQAAFRAGAPNSDDVTLMAIRRL